VPPESENPLQSLTASRVVVVAGKGGVGKTTVTAVIARAASRSGLRVLVVELDGKPTLAQLVPDLSVLAISAPDALDEYLREHGFGRIATRLSKTGVIDVVGTAAPGIDDIVVLGKIKQLDRSGEYDLIVVDGPAAGHAITFLTAASGLADSVRNGPIRTQADEVLDMLHDPARCQVVLVSLPEATPVNEVVETAYALEDQVGVQLGPVVLNAVDQSAPMPNIAEVDEAVARSAPDDGVSLRRAADFRRGRLAMQDTEQARLARELPLRIVTLPDRRRAGLGPDDIDALADLLLDAAGTTGDDIGPTPDPIGASPSRDSVEISLGFDGTARSVIDDSSVIVCCGSGGVGKTTTAAVIGLEAARRGRRVVVVTIDPARRLADALGLTAGLSAAPQRIDLADTFADGRTDTRIDGRTDTRIDTVTVPPGELWAMMLDAAATFDDLVRSHAEDPDQVAGILGNPFYRNIAGALSGTQEYMAAEVLHQLHADDRFDLVVVDTPPSRNALDFLEAPGVLARFLDHRVFKLMMLPTKGGFKVLTAATQPLLRAIGKVVGSDVLADSVAFFQAFAGMEAGFRQRAKDVVALIRARETAFVVVSSAHHDTIAEAVWFAQQLVDQGVGATGTGADLVVVNRMHPTFGDGIAGDARRLADDAARDGDAVVAQLWANVFDLRSARERELAVIEPLAEISGRDRMVVLPLLDRDVHDLDGLRQIAGHLFEPDR
jgi:anion-transporting  ArsA/GET3 family ATPase